MIHGSWFQVPCSKFHVPGSQAEVARGLSIETGHLAGVLFALDEGEDVLAGGDAGIAVFEGVADAIAIDGEVTVGVLTFNAGSCYNDIHTFNI